MSDYMKQRFHEYNIELRPTSSYNPRSNGIIERRHKLIRDALCATGNNSSWYQALPDIELILNNTPYSEHTTAERVYGKAVRLPVDIIIDRKIDDNVAEQTAELFKTLNKINSKEFVERRTQSESYIPKQLDQAKLVYLRNENPASKKYIRYSGPYQVKDMGKKHVWTELRESPKIE